MLHRSPSRFLHLSLEVAELPLDVLESTDLLGEGALEGGGVGVEVAELHDAQFAEGGDNFAADFGGDVELAERHVGAAEEGVGVGHAGRWLGGDRGRPGR